MSTDTEKSTPLRPEHEKTEAELVISNTTSLQIYTVIHQISSKSSIYIKENIVNTHGNILHIQWWKMQKQNLFI